MEILFDFFLTSNETELTCSEDLALKKAETKQVIQKLLEQY